MILYLGTYTEIIVGDFGGHADGIYCCDFNPKTAELTFLHTTPVRNPSYLSLHPNQRFLYAVEEVLKEKSPLVNAFAIQEDYSLRLINQQSIPGGLPCHLDFVSEDLLAIACYETGHVVAYPIAQDGSLEAASFINQHQGSSANPDRQEGAHAHVIAPETAGRIAVCDLGMDEVLFYELDAQSRQLVLKEQDTLKIPAGNGPRHIVFHPGGNYAFVLNELTATVSVLKKEAGKWFLQTTHAALPETYQDEPAGSAIRVHPSGRFVYSGNRGHDSITIFHFDETNGSLKLIEHQFTGGKTPREFNLSPDGQWLLAAHQDSDSVVVFRVNDKNGLLEKRGEYEVRSPVCLKWV